MSHRILTVAQKTDDKFLRQRTKPVDLSSWNRTEIKTLLDQMRRTMRQSNGVGLSANQIGLMHRLFVAEVPTQNGGKKFYAIFNPVIEKRSKETTLLEEGCLSVPHQYGQIERTERIILKGFDQNGKSVKIKAWGLLAQVFQHEVDHLDGKLFIDKAEKLYETPVSERLHKREVLRNKV